MDNDIGNSLNLSVNAFHTDFKVSPFNGSGGIETRTAIIRKGLAHIEHGFGTTPESSRFMRVFARVLPYR